MQNTGAIQHFWRRPESEKGVMFQYRQGVWGKRIPTENWYFTFKA